jgi:hypothetical protein
MVDILARVVYQVYAGEEGSQAKEVEKQEETLQNNAYIAALL